jgi:DNA helicase-2/ATP-dependent DNA helicase PcrA
VPITPAQTAAAEQRQWQVAQDAAPQVRLIAGPGTGKSATIERRVAHVLNNNAAPDRVHVISFTRATCGELAGRVAAYCANQACAAVVDQIHLSTMHSMALRILRAAAVLTTLYPADPFVLDDWERENVYDVELANAVGCARGRAAQVRLAHDAQWQTLNPQFIAQPAITPAEQHGFNAFHGTRRNLYSCVLPGEVIFECVTRIQQGAIQLHQLPQMEHLIVDEYQDLNACDQEFVRLLVGNGAILFVAGDDDQSIYSFRHANPNGIVQFNATYPAATTHTLDDCFRCAPAILGPAVAMVAFNPNRLPKQLHSLYATAAPPVQGRIAVWSFPTGQQEAAAIAASCQQLLAAGMAGQEDQIVILISNRRLQLLPIAQELANLGLPFDPPGGLAVRDETPIRAAYSTLRILRDRATNQPDYVAHRALLGQLYGVGPNTARAVGDLCVANNQNFRELFYLQATPHWLTAAPARAVARVQAAIQQVGGWSLQDTIGVRGGDVAQILAGVVFHGSAQAAAHVAAWNAFVASLPADMTLEEVLDFLAADDEAEQRQTLDAVRARLGIEEGTAQQPRRIRILTMHGAKGLSGKVVFIPSAEQGIMPSFRAIQAAGLLNEQRRLFYVSVTRAKAACIISHATTHTGAAAFLIHGRSPATLPRSQFLNEMAAVSVNRGGGLSPAEAAQIVADVNNL